VKEKANSESERGRGARVGAVIAGICKKEKK
jgi:hypothetical protein